MSADIRTVKTDKGDFQYNSDMPMGALKGLLGGAKDGNLEALVENLAKFVTAWPFGGTPSDPAAWDDLTRTEFNAVIKGIMEDLGSLGEE